MVPANADRNERLARQHVQGLFNEGDVDRDVLTDGFRIYANSHDARTVDEQLRAVAAYREAFPDIGTAIEDSFATGDRVAVRGTVRGTHEGSFMGVTPTGIEVAAPFVGVFALKDGSLAEARIVADNAGLHDQVVAAAED